MNPSELEAFLTANRIATLTILKHINGWQLGIRALPGSPLHLPAAELADSYRIARGATLDEAFAAMAALVPAEEDVFA